MAEYLSLYRKDYLWPPLKPYFPRTDITCPIAGPVIPEVPKRICTCQDEDDNNNSGKLVNDRDRTYSPTRADVVFGNCPKTETLTYSETDACLKKLLENNPSLLNVLKKVPLSAAIVKFNKERLKTTYQVDFDHSPVGSSDVSGLPKKPEPCPLDDPTPPEVDCRGLQKSHTAMLKRRYPDKGKCEFKNPCEKKAAKKPKQKFDESNTPAFQRKRLPSWSSEYREGIGRNGAELMHMYSVRKARLKRK